MPSLVQPSQSLTSDPTFRQIDIAARTALFLRGSSLHSSPSWCSGCLYYRRFVICQLRMFVRVSLVSLWDETSSTDLPTGIVNKRVSCNVKNSRCQTSISFNRRRNLSFSPFFRLTTSSQNACFVFDIHHRVSRSIEMKHALSIPARY